MKSGWKVSTNYCGDITSYKVYRLYDVQKVDEDFNREYKDKVYYSKDKAQRDADEANKKDSERFWKHKDCY